MNNPYESPSTDEQDTEKVDWNFLSIIIFFFICYGFASLVSDLWRIIIH